MPSPDDLRLEDFLAGPEEDPRFVRDGVRLSFWLLCLTSGQAQQQQLGAERLQAIHYGAEDLNDERDVVPLADGAWRAAIRHAVRDPLFDGLALGRLLIEETLASNAEWQRHLDNGFAASQQTAQRMGQLFQRLTDRLRGPREAPERHARRLGQVLCAGLATTVRDVETADEDAGGMTVAIVCSFVTAELDEEWLANPDLIRACLGSRSFRYHLYPIFERLGPAAHDFLPDIERLVTSEGEHPWNVARVMGALIRDDAPAIDRRLTSWMGDRQAAEAVAPVLAAVGSAAVARCPRFSPLIREGLTATDAWRRASAAYLAGFLPAADTGVVRQLIALTTDEDGWVAGAAITALGDLRVNSDLAVSALAAALTTFSEPNPDHGASGRICRALAAFTAEEVAQHAAEPLSRRLYSASDGSGWVDDAACDALVRLGPSARVVLPQVQEAYVAAAEEAERIEVLNRQSIERDGEDRAVTRGAPDANRIASVLDALSRSEA